MATATTPESQAAPPVWYSLSGEDVAAKLGVDVRTGLSTSEAESRRAQYGPNKFAEAPTEPGWKAFLRQYQELMQIVLLVAGA